MAVPLIVWGIVALVGYLGASAAYDNVTTDSAQGKAKDMQQKLQDYSKSVSTKQFEAYLRDAMALGYIDGNTNKNALAAYTKLRNNNYDFSKISKEEANAVTGLYNQLYNNSANFKSQWDKTYSNMSDEEKLNFINSASTAGATIPAPAYLDTSFERYQREVEPLKLYNNKELADLYKLDFNLDNIKQDYNEAAQANVDYNSWLSDLMANVGERDNTYNQTSYLDAIRKTKSDAVLKGMSNGARAAAEVIANNEALQNKVNANTDVATKRFETMNDALLNRAQSDINATKVYTDLAQALSTAGGTFYANDVNRMGQDLLSNANFLSADENLRSNRQAQNNLMASIYNNVSAQNNAISNGVNNVDWLFQNVYMPAANNNVNEALSDFIGTQYAQATGAADPMTKWGVLNK